MAKAIFIDSTLCTGCRGCQVACKQWHDLPAEETKNTGSYQNPPDLSFNTYKLVRMKEEYINGRLQWLFFPEQCRHCVDAPCMEAADNPNAIYKDNATGAVLYTAQTSQTDSEAIIDSCPYNVPRTGKGGLLAKCDFCNDRVRNGLEPACVKTCPTGAMQFGSRGDILNIAKKRVSEVRSQYPQVQLIDKDEVNVIYLTAHPPRMYHEFAMGGPNTHGMTRQVAFRRMVRPFKNAAKALSG